MTLSAKRALLALVPFCVVGCGTQAIAASNGAMTVTLENDLFTGSDNNYTNGIGVTWVSSDIDSCGRFVKGWGGLWGFLPFVGDEGYTTYASWTVAQEMHVPDDITLPDPPETDQPYAGVLYLDSVLYARAHRRAYAWEFMLGVVGPASGAEDVQKWLHELIGSDEPMGWDTQLPNELVVNVSLASAYLWAEGGAGGSARWRLVPVGNAGLGTYFTGAGLGMYGEVGWNLVDALGGTALREGLHAASTVGVGPVDGWSVAFFGGFAGHAVAHYLPLDGTVFKDSRSVDTKPFVGGASLGLSVRRGGFAFSLATSFTTKAFETQKKGAELGTFSVCWYF